MVEWIPEKDFEKTAYGQLNSELAGKKYFGKLDKSKLPDGAVIIPDPLHGYSGIIRGKDGKAIGKVDLG